MHRTSTALLFHTVCGTFLCILLCGNTVSAQAPKEGEKSPESESASGTTLEPGADFVCEADVFYNWKPQPSPKKFGTPEPSPAGTPSAEGTPSSEVRVFFTTAGEQGVVEDEVKNRLNTKIPLMQRQATDYCKTTHQDHTLCVSAKLRANFEHYNKLDFVSRRAMVDAINTDCSNKMGKCLGTEVTEIKCHINRSPEVPPHTATEGGEAGKDGKEAKEKKK